ncbi:AMP-binding protein [uncultured Arcticibacterium sp.]|uniref:AMP-binding protein n=1 Tax=uncultured Arcticibacterium sp. TaxID=2173042 RepID=UPI0030F6FD98
MEISNKKTFLDYLYHWEKTKPKEVYLKQPFGDTYRDLTWAEAADQVRRMANFLKSQKLPEKSNIGLVSKNCAEWILTDLAIMMAGHISVPFYPTLTGDQINHVITHSGCQILFVGKIDKYQELKPGIPEGITCISFPAYNPDKAHLQWNDILKTNDPLEVNFYPDLDDIFTIIYTSGTTGNPKGVMMPYRSMSEGIYNTRHLTKLNIDACRFFSYLPLSHIAERNVVEAGSIFSGGTVYFAESLATFAENLRVASPTHFLAVPRIWTKFQLGILAKMPQKNLNVLLKIPVVKNIIKKKITAGLGLTDAVLILTGAAPMPITLIKWFRNLGITIQEVYGMSENLGAVCMMPIDNIKDGSVGKVFPKMEVKIDPDNGEILTRSPWNMYGYFKEPEMTDNTIDKEGFIHTGDVGELDAEGFLKITGRVKEMYKTSKGEYVAPAQIELGFADNEMIEQICVVGQLLPQPIALVNLSPIGLQESRESVTAALAKNLEELNPKLKSYEKIRKMVVLSEAWSEENNCLTPTLKIKRIVIENKFDNHFQAWYDHPNTIVWE